mmetsp:Transcript_36388/g.63449  ORF Transcript_36388/g.63449 Transcript_36388/m.63449 type:complete len:257 (+) Transcript_36388:450-1220(+)
MQAIIGLRLPEDKVLRRRLVRKITGCGAAASAPIPHVGGDSRGGGVCTAVTVALQLTAVALALLPEACFPIHSCIAGFMAAVVLRPLAGVSKCARHDAGVPGAEARVVVAGLGCELVTKQCWRPVKSNQVAQKVAHGVPGTSIGPVSQPALHPLVFQFRPAGAASCPTTSHELVTLSFIVLELSQPERGKAPRFPGPHSSEVEGSHGELKTKFVSKLAQQPPTEISNIVVQPQPNSIETKMTVQIAQQMGLGPCNI